MEAWMETKFEAYEYVCTQLHRAPRRQDGKRERESHEGERKSQFQRWQHHFSLLRSSSFSWHQRPFFDWFRSCRTAWLTARPIQQTICRLKTNISLLLPFSKLNRKICLSSFFLDPFDFGWSGWPACTRRRLVNKYMCRVSIKITALMRWYPQYCLPCHSHEISLLYWWYIQTDLNKNKTSPIMKKKSPNLHFFHDSQFQINMQNDSIRAQRLCQTPSLLTSVIQQ